MRSLGRLGDLSRRSRLSNPPGVRGSQLSPATDEVDLGTVEVASLAPGVYAADVVLPTTGESEVQVSLRTTEFDNPVRTVTFEVP
ncbi:hypothetical protein [Myceligenerans pegani]|uniref:Uncharacterized protein n=1 Tax=Myceligenerans pegani TaxID=2776917 RepID=A0ABR9MYU2_9MICO|nr:hypothetical protein [Myceligenerans sp. TRM 65318]MBE1876553.1 hypothetical protein [Myceligenerans sp. TRM 65318]MBE3018824.1 hypothetical protein [Myceligenerans sp. TRM 65318]